MIGVIVPATDEPEEVSRGQFTKPSLALDANLARMRWSMNSVGWVVSFH